MLPEALLKSRNIKPDSEASTDKAALESIAAQRQGSDQIVSDGVTPSRAQVQTPGARGSIAGSGSATWRGVVSVPSVSSTAEIASASSSTAALASATAWSLGIAWSGNDLVVRCNGATPATDFRTYTLTALRTNYSGQVIELEVYWVSGSTAPVARVNGTVAAGTAADGAGTDPDWLSASLVPTYHLTGYNYPAGTSPVGCWILGALSDADRTYWRTTGKPPLWISMGGSAAQVPSGGFVVTTGTVDSFVSASESGWSGDPSAGPWRVQSPVFASRPVGTRMLVTFNCVLGSVVGTAVNLRTGSVTGSNTVTVVAGSNSMILEATTAVDRLTFASGGLGAGLSITNLKCVVLGALSLRLIQRGGVIGDATNIGDNPARLVGMRAITDKKDFQWKTPPIATDAIATIQLLGGACFSDPAVTSIDVLEPEGTGAETSSIGDGTTPTKYTASTAKAVGPNRPAIASHFPADSAKTGLFYNITAAGAAGTITRINVMGHVR